MIRVQAEPFDVGLELKTFSVGRRDIGAVASFAGFVRDMAGGQPIDAMTLEHYPGMTERKLEEIEAEAQHRWPLQASLVIHRYGRMEPGEPIVLVATAALHRAAALDSCAFLIDWLKIKAPFWKLEEGPDGATWVEAKTSDDAAGARWNQSSRDVETKLDRQ